jgi:hypothetical protein
MDREERKRLWRERNGKHPILDAGNPLADIVAEDDHLAYLRKRAASGKVRVDSDLARLLQVSDLEVALCEATDRLVTYALVHGEKVLAVRLRKMRRGSAHDWALEVG